MWYIRMNIARGYILHFIQEINVTAREGTTEVNTSEFLYIVPSRTRATCGAWSPYQIRKNAGCACAGNAGIVFPASTG